MKNVHALVTGDAITGPIPIDHKKHPQGWVDVSPSVLYFDDRAHAEAVAAAIEDKHYEQGTHPAQVAAADVAAVTDGTAL